MYKYTTTVGVETCDDVINFEFEKIQCAGKWLCICMKIYMQSECSACLVEMKKDNGHAKMFTSESIFVLKLRLF